MRDATALEWQQTSVTNHQPTMLDLARERPEFPTNRTQQGSQR